MSSYQRVKTKNTPNVNNVKQRSSYDEYRRYFEMMGVVESINTEYENSYARNQYNQQQNIENLQTQINNANANVQKITNQYNRELSNNAKKVATLNKRIDDQNRYYNNRISQLAKEYQDKISRLRTEMAQVDRKIDSAVGEMKNELRRQKIELEKKINTEIENNRREFERAIQKEKEERNEKIGAIRAAFNAELIQTRNVLSSDIKQVREYISSKENDQKQIANEYLSAASIVLQSLENQNIDLYFPGRLNKMRQQAETFRQFLNSPATYSTALTKAYDLYSEGIEVSNELYLKIVERNEAHRLLVENFGEVYSIAKDIKDLYYEIPTSEGIETIKAEVDYWTKGDLRKTLDMVNDMLKIINDDKLTTDEIKENIAKLKEMKISLSEEQQKAKIRLLASARRVDMINILDSALKKCGFDNQPECKFVEGDNRNDLWAKFSNGDGKEVVAICKYDEDDDAYDIDYHLFFDTTSQEEYDAYHKEIETAISESGTEIKEVKCVEGKGAANTHTELKNFNNIKQERI